MPTVFFLRSVFFCQRKIAFVSQWSSLLPHVVLFFVFGFQLAESTTRIKTAEAQLNALMQAQVSLREA